MINEASHVSGEAGSPAAPGRLLYVDAIRAFAILMVIIVHVSGDVLTDRAGAIDRAWWICNWFNSFARTGVPLFVMISGALLLDPSKRETIGTFLRRRFLRVFLPVIAWMPVFFWWGQQPDVPLSVSRVFQMILAGTVYYHLWFVYMLAGLYLATPILRVYIRGADRRDLGYFALIWLIAAAVLPSLTEFTHIDLGLTFFVTTGFVGFFVGGYYLRVVTVNRRVRAWLPIVVLLMTAVTGFVTFLMSSEPGVLDETFYEALRPNIVVMSFAAYLWLKDCDFAALQARMPFLNRIIRIVSGTSFSVYLIHVLILQMLIQHVGLQALTLTPVFGILATTAVTLVLSVLVTTLMRKVPVVRFFFP